MEGVDLDYLNSYIIVRELISSSSLYSYLSEYNKQDTPDTNTHIINICEKLMYKYIVKANKSTLWYEIDGC